MQLFFHCHINISLSFMNRMLCLIFVTCKTRWVQLSRESLPSVLKLMASWFWSYRRVRAWSETVTEKNNISAVLFSSSILEKKKYKRKKSMVASGPVGVFHLYNFNQKTVESLDAQPLMLLQLLSLTFTNTISILYMTANSQLLSDTHPPHVILTTISDIL